MSGATSLKEKLRSLGCPKHECMEKPFTRRLTSRLKATAILLALSFYAFAISRQVHAFPVTPPRVRFTGVLVPISDQSRNGLLENLNVIIETERLTFLIDKMQIVGGVGLNRVLLQRLFPPLLHLTGPDDLVGRLKRLETTHKALTIEGLLYTVSRTLFLIQVDEVDECEQLTDGSMCPVS